MKVDGKNNIDVCVVYFVYAVKEYFMNKKQLINILKK